MDASKHKGYNGLLEKMARELEPNGKSVSSPPTIHPFGGYWLHSALITT
jgi:hypothetical protein